MLLVLASLALRGALACAPSDDDILDERPRTLVERELDALRDLVLRLRRTRPEVFPSADALGARRALPDDADERDVASLLGRELLLLERTVSLLEQSRSPADPPLAKRFTTFHARQELSLDLPPDASVEIVALVLSTVGRTPLVAPDLRTDARGDWSTVDRLARAAVGEARAPADVAERLWAFLVDERAHGPPPTESGELHDPVKLLTVYGYGLCDDVANAFVHLARRLGLQARVWALGGHVVPEVFFDGSWHLFDPDHEVYYRGADGRVLGVDDLARDPSLLGLAVRRPGRAARSVDPERVAAIYASGDDNRVVEYPEPSGFHAMRLVLGPGESVVLHARSLGYRVTDTRFESADEACNGEWTRTFALEQAGAMTVPCRLPWPILGGTLRLALPAATERDASDDDGAGAVVAADAPGPRALPRPAAALLVGDVVHPLPPPVEVDGELVFDLDALLARADGEPPYDIVLQLDVPAAAVGAGARLDLVFQHARAALPRLQPGANTLHWSCEQGSAEVSLLYRVR